MPSCMRVHSAARDSADSCMRKRTIALRLFRDDQSPRLLFRCTSETGCKVAINLCRHWWPSVESCGLLSHFSTRRWTRIPFQSLLDLQARDFTVFAFVFDASESALTLRQIRTASAGRHDDQLRQKIRWLNRQRRFLIQLPSMSPHQLEMMTRVVSGFSLCF